MRFKLLCALLGTGLGCLPNSALVAQSITSSERPDRPSAVARLEVIGQSTIDVQSAYTKKRWVGIRSKHSAKCPQVAGWSVEPLLARALAALEGGNLSPEQRADRNLLHKLGLDRFCVYTTGLNPAPAFIPPPGLKAERDRMALSANGDLAELISPTLAGHFRSQTGGGSPLPLQDGKPTVRLTFIDGHPTENPVSTRPSTGSQHGYTLAQLARQLVCHGPCAASIASRRALHYVDLPEDQEWPPSPASESQGGNLGLVGDLAPAIVEAVLDWRNKGDTEHLILNISLGWDGELFGDLDAHKASELEPSVWAVRRALRFAIKRGVLVIASAGNRRAGPVPSSLPILPAAWELRRPGHLPFCPGRKLVYSVAGMDWQGLPLPNSRRGGRPRRAAYGDHAVAIDEDGPTPIYTGTSVSAAVVSSVAAMVWHLRPELRPRQVMKMVSRSGELVNARADFYPWKPFTDLLAPRQRRVSLCTAVTRACGPDATLCPKLTSAPVCPTWDRHSPQLASFRPPKATTKTSSSPAVKIPLPSHPPCDPLTELWTTDGKIPPAPCPTDQFGGITDQRWTWPQPPEVPCPGCKLVPDPPSTTAYQNESDLEDSDGQSPQVLASGQLYALDLEIDATWWPTIASATLDIYRTVDGVPVKIFTHPIDLGAGWDQIITGLGDGQSLVDCTSMVNFEVKEADGTSKSVQNPVIVDP